MKKISFKKIMSITLSLLMLFTFSMNNVLAFNAGEKVSKKTIKLLSDTENERTVMGTYKGDILYATLNKKTNEITMESVEKSKFKVFGVSIGGDKVKKYSVKKHGTYAEIIDKKNGKVHKVNIDDSTAEAQIWILGIPLVEILGAAVLAALATLTISGIVYVAATEIDMVLKKKENYDYYMGFVVPGDDVYIGPAITRDEAETLCYAGKSVWCSNQIYAFDLAKEIGHGRPPVGPETGTGEGKQYPHYHPYDRTPYGCHIFFFI